MVLIKIVIIIRGFVVFIILVVIIVFFIVVLVIGNVIIFFKGVIEVFILSLQFVELSGKMNEGQGGENGFGRKVFGRFKVIDFNLSLRNLFFEIFLNFL